MSSEDDDNNKLLINRKIMVISIVSFFTILFLILLRFCIRHLIKKQQGRRRRANIYRIRTQIIPLEHDDLHHQPKVGLDPSIKSSLPKFSYNPTVQLNGQVCEAIECSVCLSNIVEDDTVRLLPNCKHIFHLACIDEWLGSNTTCPVCRTMAEPKVEPEQSDLSTRVKPTAPPVEESASGQSASGLSSSGRMVSRERSMRIQDAEDLERQ